MSHLFKTRLQTYAQKRNISFPTYACEMQGPPHARLFKARVTIDSVTYEGPEFCTTLKDAEHAAAKVAFMSLSPDGSQEEDCLYKSLLQELTQKKGLLLPIYATNRTGPPHMPSFASTVEVAGECYIGQEARTKKQAEMNAARVAYNALTEGGPRANNTASFSDLQMVGASSSGSSSLQTVVNNKKETTLPVTSKIQTTINDQANHSIAKEAEKAKAPSEEVQKRTMILPTVAIHQSQPKVASNVVDVSKPNMRRENLVTQPTQAREGASSNNVIKNQLLVASSTSNQVMESGAARPHKVVIRPHIQGMSYDGPIQVSDDEWVAMKVNVDDET